MYIYIYIYVYNYVRFRKNRVGDLWFQKYRENCSENLELPRNEWETAEKNTWKLWSDSCVTAAPWLKPLRLPCAWSPGTGEGGDWWSWPMGVKAEGIPRVFHCQLQKMPTSLGYPLSVFNKNSTLHLGALDSPGWHNHSLILFYIVRYTISRTHPSQPTGTYTLNELQKRKEKKKKS